MSSPAPPEAEPEFLALIERLEKELGEHGRVVLPDVAIAERASAALRARGKAPEFHLRISLDDDGVLLCSND